MSSQQQFTSTTNNYRPPGGSVGLSNHYAVSQTPNQAINKSISVVNTKVLNRNYF
jgi:hypothetical protein